MDEDLYAPEHVWLGLLGPEDRLVFAAPYGALAIEGFDIFFWADVDFVRMRRGSDWCPWERVRARWEARRMGWWEKEWCNFWPYGGSSNFPLLHGMFCD